MHIAFPIELHATQGTFRPLSSTYANFRDQSMRFLQNMHKPHVFESMSGACCFACASKPRKAAEASEWNCSTRLSEDESESESESGDELDVRDATVSEAGARAATGDGAAREDEASPALALEEASPALSLEVEDGTAPWLESEAASEHGGGGSESATLNASPELWKHGGSDAGGEGGISQAADAERRPVLEGGA